MEGEVTYSAYEGVYMETLFWYLKYLLAQMMEKLQIEEWITQTKKFDIWHNLKQQCIGSRLNRKKLIGNMRDVHESSQHNLTPWKYKDIWSQSTSWLAMLVLLCEFSAEIVHWFSVRGGKVE